MKLEGQVVSLELAKEMKELGAGQDSLWCWVKCLPGDEYELTLTWDLDLRQGTYAAHTVAELGEMFPPFFSSYKTEYDGWQCESPWGFNDRYVINSQKYQIYEKVLHAIPRRLVQEANTEANARAKMVTHLIKEGILKAEELGK